MNKWYENLIEADMIVFTTPLCYYAMSTYIKAVIERLHAQNAKLADNKETMFLAAFYGANDWTMEALDKNYACT